LVATIADRGSPIERNLPQRAYVSVEPLGVHFGDVK